MSKARPDDTRAWMNELTAEMEERRKEVVRGGGEARQQKQRDAGKLTARERIAKLLDEGSFTELSVFTEHAGLSLMNGLSEEAEIDTDGRLVLPQRLREKIGLDDRAFFMAQGDYLKVSTPETHEADLRAIEADMPALEPGADPLSLLPPSPES